MAFNPKCPKLPWMVDFYTTEDGKVYNTQMEAAFANTTLEYMSSLNIKSRPKYFRETQLVAIISPYVSCSDLEQIMDLQVRVFNIRAIDNQRVLETLSKIRAVNTSYSRDTGKIFPLAIAVEVRGPEIHIAKVTTEASECPKTVKYAIQTVTEQYTYETEHFETKIISPKEKSFSITLESDVPILCKEMLNITKPTHHFYGWNRGIKEIEPGTFENQNIDSQLLLSDNSLTIIRKGTFKNILIHQLDLTKNKITTIEKEALDNLPMLSILNLDRNKIKDFHPDSITLTPSLTFFGISVNKLMKLEENHFSFMNKKRNVGVGLADNKLTEIHPKAFEGIDVFTLNLTRNHLSSIPKEVFTDNKLSYLGIAYNDLTHLDQEFFDMNTTTLRDVQLEGNNFDKETLEKLEPFMKIIKENRKQFRRFRQFDDTPHHN